MFESPDQPEYPGEQLNFISASRTVMRAEAHATQSHVWDLEPVPETM
jgi:hypothetical protein